MICAKNDSICGSFACFVSTVLNCSATSNATSRRSDGDVCSIPSRSWITDFSLVSLPGQGDHPRSPVSGNTRDTHAEEDSRGLRDVGGSACDWTTFRRSGRTAAQRTTTVEMARMTAEWPAAEEGEFLARLLPESPRWCCAGQAVGKRLFGGDPRPGQLVQLAQMYDSQDGDQDARELRHRALCGPPSPLDARARSLLTSA
jgi:hypothetical protein